MDGLRDKVKPVCCTVLPFTFVEAVGTMNEKLFALSHTREWPVAVGAQAEMAAT